MKVAVPVFPGSNCDADTYHALRHVMEWRAEYVWHRQRDLSRFDAVVLPGGFSYGDYLRAGAIARFSPVMEGVRDFAAAGRPVLGICNGFQILCEAGLLPGALRANDRLRFQCRFVWLRVETVETPFTAACEPGQLLRLPIAHGEGNYFVDADRLERLATHGQIVFRYVDEEGRATAAHNPNGSVDNIAGIVNRDGNVVGMMPHPERAVETLLGSTDGRRVFASLARWLERVREGAVHGDA